MTRVLVLGAHGQIARFATSLFLKNTDAQLTLYLRNARRLSLSGSNGRVRIVEGDVLDTDMLQAALVGQDVVYANLAGDLESQARSVISAMEKSGVKRLIWISSMGIYDEVPGERFGSILEPYRRSARMIEDSMLEYTIIRSAWLSNRDEIDYGTTRKGEFFKNPQGVVSRKSVADLVVKLAMQPGNDIRSSLGVHSL